MSDRLKRFDDEYADIIAGHVSTHATRVRLLIKAFSSDGVIESYLKRYGKFVPTLWMLRELNGWTGYGDLGLLPYYVDLIDEPSDRLVLAFPEDTPPLPKTVFYVGNKWKIPPELWSYDVEKLPCFDWPLSYTVCLLFKC